MKASFRGAVNLFACVLAGKRISPRILGAHARYPLLFIILIVCYVPLASSATLTRFADITFPQSVMVNQEGDVYVHSLSLLGDGGLYRFDSQGRRLAYNPNLFGSIRLVEDSERGVIWGLEKRGGLYVIDPVTLDSRFFLNIAVHGFPHEPVLNVLSGEYVTLPMLSHIIFGDIALRSLGHDGLELYFSGMQGPGGSQFVGRLRLPNDPLATGSAVHTDVLVASFPLPTPVIPPPLDTQGPGLALNPDGTLIASLVYHPQSRPGAGFVSPFYIVKMHVDFKSTGVGYPELTLGYPSRQLMSMGMSESKIDSGFLVGAFAQGQACSGGPAILYVSPGVDRVDCVVDLVNTTLGTLAPGGVDMTTDGRSVYFTISPMNLVAKAEVNLQAPVPDDPPDVQFDRDKTQWRVAEIYVATLGYAPEADGLDYWTDEIDYKPYWDTLSVAQSFFDQPGVQAVYPSGQPYDVFINALYQNIYKGPPDEEGRRYWLTELQSGRLQRNQMIIALIEGGWANPAAATEMRGFGHRVDVSLNFASYLRSRGIRFGALTQAQQECVRQAGRSVIVDVTEDRGSRDRALQKIPSVLGCL
ncbi:DUF4214 domain-containing protein [Ectothiorhodospira variabilis]|uniref:DUF4214 domain-containing protein n=1 Tax=Ectothiorhodospira variabilis TaxID=505694 RepID=UPI001EFACB5A|nr:DUF4214 domain-containing protein [Ectothiorhodospira variabilis]MCG5498944.1 DUF4214 domain-containing protein [Ectothiorhodospira variabilis]